MMLRSEVEYHQLRYTCLKSPTLERDEGEAGLMIQKTDPDGEHTDKVSSACYYSTFKTFEEDLNRRVWPLSVNNSS